MSKITMDAISSAFNKLSASEKLKAEVELLTSFSSDTVYRLRYDTMQYDYISPAVINLLGFSSAELAHINLRSLIIETRIVSDGMKVVESYEGLEENRKRGEVNKWQADYLMRTKDGRKVWVSDISYPWFDDEGAIIGSKGSLRDITERVNAEHKLYCEIMKQDYSDDLTGLANLRTFWVRLEEEIRRTRRGKDIMSLMLLEINNVDKIRNIYDDKMAEDIIISIAMLLRKKLREIDIIARIEGGKFGVIMPETPLEGAKMAASRIIKVITEDNFLAGSKENNITSVAVSVGLTSLSHDKEISAKELFELSDSQLFAAKHKEGSQVSA